MAETSMSKSSVLTEIEAYVDDFMKKRPNSTVKSIFSELKSSIEKVRFSWVTVLNQWMFHCFFVNITKVNFDKRKLYHSWTME